MHHLLTPQDDLQGIPLGNADFSWFTDGSHLKGDNGKYSARYDIKTPFDVVDAASLPLVTSAQTELHAFTWAYSLAKDKTANI